MTNTFISDPCTLTRGSKRILTRKTRRNSPGNHGRPHPPPPPTSPAPRALAPPDIIIFSFFVILLLLFFLFFFFFYFFAFLSVANRNPICLLFYVPFRVFIVLLARGVSCTTASVSAPAASARARRHYHPAARQRWRAQSNVSADEVTRVGGQERRRGCAYGHALFETVHICTYTTLMNIAITFSDGRCG